MSLLTELLIPEYDYHIQNLINSVLLIGLYDKLSVKSISDNILFKEKETDILAIGTEDDIEELKRCGYQEVLYEDYTNTVINGIVSYKETKEYKIQNFKKIIKLADTEIGISFKDNVVNITGQNPYKLIKSINFDFNIDEFLIDEYGFVYILSGEDFIKSHIAMNFYKPDDTHDCVTSIEDIQFLYKVKLNDIKQLLSVDDYNIYYLKKDKTIIKCELGRKYYFLKDGQLFFNVIDKTDKITVQVEHTHFYDLISLLGLNKFYINGKKLSTKYADNFKNILKFPFNSTLNGMLNYSDFLNNKDYKIDKDIDFIKIEGNFNYEYKKGLFEIELRVDKTKNQNNAYVHMNLLYNGECVKSISGNTVNGIIYFCNLKFIFYKDVYNDVIKIPIEIKDDYSVKVINRYEYIDEKSLINDFVDLSKVDQFFRRDSIKHQLIETDYNKGFFIIKNYIKNYKERNFTKDFAVRFIEKNGSPSMLWRQIKNKDYFLAFKTYSVTKIIKPKRTEKQLFKITRNNFKINLKNITKTI